MVIKKGCETLRQWALLLLLWGVQFLFIAALEWLVCRFFCLEFKWWPAIAMCIVFVLAEVFLAWREDVKERRQRGR